MKKNILLFAIVFCLNAQATIHTILVSDYAFTPDSLSTVVVGDTIEWQWVTGSQFHTTTCEPSSQGPGNSLPAGAEPWDGQINPFTPTFDYVVKVPGTYVYWSTPFAPYMTGTFTASGALPVKLSSLQLSSLQNGTVTLSWQTQNEENVNYFSIRRSLNGTKFTEIDRVFSFDNSVTKSYSYIDTKLSPEHKFYYYNIAVVDHDDKKLFSNVVLFKNLKAKSKLILSVSPNPATGSMQLSFNAEKEGKMNVSIVSLEGKTVMRKTFRAFVGVNNGLIQLGNLSAGVYSLVCEMNGERETRKIVKRL